MGEYEEGGSNSSSNEYKLYEPSLDEPRSHEENSEREDGGGVQEQTNAVVRRFRGFSLYVVKTQSFLSSF